MSHKPGCHYFLQGLQLPLQPLRGLLPILLLGEQRHNGVSSLPKTVTRQRRDCDLNPGPSAPESSTLTTRLTEPPSRYIIDSGIEIEQTGRKKSFPVPLWVGVYVVLSPPPRLLPVAKPHMIKHIDALRREYIG